MRLRYWAKHHVYFAESSFGEKDILKDAGFIWDKIVRKHWASHDIDVVSKLVRYADPECQEAIAAAKRARFDSIQKSLATDSSHHFPAPDGLAYLPYQKAGIEFALNLPSVIFGDDMGLGKTIEAIGTINTNPDRYRHVLVICKASLKINWFRELTKWLVVPRHVEMVTNGGFPHADIVIINFDRLAKHAQTIRSEEWDLIVIDESQHLGNRKAQRTVALFGGKLKGEKLEPVRSKYKMALTGTPFKNRVPELYPLLHWLAPQEFPSFYRYAKDFSSVSVGQFGTDFSGASMEEAEKIAKAEKLQKKLRSLLMIRRMKADVMKELPPIRYQVIELPCPPEHRALIMNQTAHYDAGQAWIDQMKERVRQAQLANNKEEYHEALAQLQEGQRVTFKEISEMRHKVAQVKLPIVLQYLKDVYAETNEKQIVFGHHRDILETCVIEFPGSVLLYGGMSETDKQVAVDTFQNDPNCSHFFGSLRAAGEGLTLTSSCYVTHIEFDWTPSQMEQAAARAHRIGQTRGVLVTYLVLEGSLDARMIEVFVDKQKVFDAACNKEALESAVS